MYGIQYISNCSESSIMMLFKLTNKQLYCIVVGIFTNLGGFIALTLSMMALILHSSVGSKNMEKRHVDQKNFCYSDHGLEQR